jgi:hypothetical protein
MFSTEQQIAHIGKWLRFGKTAGRRLAAPHAVFPAMSPIFPNGFVWENGI